MPGDKKKRRLEILDAAIQVAKLTKDVGESLPVLSPLKGAMGILIMLLEGAKKAKTNADEWYNLTNDIKDRLEFVQDAVKDKLPGVDLQVLVVKYSQELERILGGLIPSDKSQASSTKVISGTIRGVLIADTESGRIKDSIAQINEAYNRFMVGLQILIRKGVEDLQSGQIRIHQTIQDHRTEHTESNAQIRAVHKEQLEVKEHSIEAEEVSLIKGLTTAYLANGSIHQKCMNGTRHSTLEEVDRWRVNLDAPQVLWLSGVAGVGKSTVARELVDKWRLDGHLAGSFFFSRDAEETRVSRLFFTTIAQQGLSRLNSQVRTVVADGVRKLFDPLSATLEEQCLLLFVKPVKVVNEPIVLVLEAMDECEPGACEQLLRIILPELFDLPYLKLLITSRPEVHIQRQLAPYEPQEVSLGLGDGSNTQDVEIYMRRRLPKATLSENQILQLIERAGGLFIWAKTVCDLVENLRGDRDTFINRVLSQNLRQINSIYRIALEQAIGRNDEEENVLAYMDILNLITAAYEPLSPNTINQLLGISNSMVIVNDLRSLLECHGPDEVIRFLHPTFRDFLCKSLDIGLYRVDINDAHALIGIRCLTTILDELHYDICRLFDHRDQVFKPEALQVLCIQRTSAALRYSCNFWGSHFASQINGGSKCYDFLSHIESFFRRSLLDWLYMIGVQGSIDNAFSVFRGFIAANINENIVQWSMDATRFLKLHWNTMRQNPYQVYRIFALCPLSSIFQQVYAKSTSFPHPTVTIGVELDWPSTMTIQTYDIQVSILLLPDNLLATGGQREAMPVFSVWDMKTTDGITSTHPCGTRHCAVTHLSFTNSGDSSLLHTGCNCGKLCKWKVSPYSCSVLSQVSLEPNGICIAWADDGTKAITFSRTEQIGYRKQGRKYYCNTHTDARPSTRHEILEDQNGGEEKDDMTDRKTWIRFTPCSGDRFVHWTPGVSKDKVAIFDSSSGRLISRKSYPQALKEIHFSPDGRNMLLWLGLPDQLELISSKDGSNSWKWTLEDGFIKSIRFFPNTTRILLLSTSATYIIDSFDGSTLYKRDAGEAVFPCCSIISPNGERIASHSRGKIQIMDHALGEYTTEYLAEEMGHILHFSWAHETLIFMQDHYDGRSSLSFQRLSSNIPTIEPVLNANPYISSSFLSPNGHFLLTVHHDDSLGLWNTTSGIKLPITGNDGKGVFRNHQIQWAQDSSTALIWSPNHLTSLRTDSGQMQIIPLPVTIALVPPSPASPLLACSFFSTSNQILSIQSDGYTTKLLLDKSISLSICRLLSPPESIYELLVSPNGQSAALICERELLVLNLSDGSCQHPLGQGKFSGAGFSPDGTHLCVVESLAYLNTVFIIWHIEMSSRSIRKCHVQLQPTWHSPKLRSVGSLTSGNRSILSTLTSRSLSKGVTSCFFDCADGKQIIPSFICYEDDQLRYGTHSLMEPYFPDDAVSCISENGIAYIEKGRMVVVDYSLLISQIRSQPGFGEIVDIWRNDWLETLEKYGEAYQKHNTLRTPMGILTRNILRSVACIKSYGTLEKVLAIIEEGDQGHPYKERVTRIREDKELTDALHGIWEDDTIV